MTWPPSCGGHTSCSRSPPLPTLCSLLSFPRVLAVMVKGPHSPVPGTLCTGRHPFPHLSPGLTAVEKRVRTLGGSVPNRPSEARSGQLSQWSLGPSPGPGSQLPMTLGSRRAASAEGTQCAGHLILCHPDISLGKEARLSPPPIQVRDGGTKSAETAPATQQGPGQSPRF